MRVVVMGELRWVSSGIRRKKLVSSEKPPRSSGIAVDRLIEDEVERIERADLDKPEGVDRRVSDWKMPVRSPKSGATVRLKLELPASAVFEHKPM